MKQTIMKAVGLTRLPKSGNVDDLIEKVEVPVPRPRDNEVMIKVYASTIHIDEIHIAQGSAIASKYMLPKNVSKDHPYILGSSVSGVIVAAGKKTTKFNIGDEVFDITNNPKTLHGSWAEYKCVDEKLVSAKPVELTHNETMAISLAAPVAKGGIDLSGASSNSNCLVIGGSGAVGSMVVQYLKALGCSVTVVCSGRNEQLVKSLGADEVVDYTKINFKDFCSDRNEQLDMVFDCVGGIEIEKDAFAILKKTGRFITYVGPEKYIGDRKLSWPEAVKMFLYLPWRSFVTRFNGGPRYIFSVKSLVKTLPEAMRLAVKHKMHVPIEKVIPLEVQAISEAIRLVLSHRTRGRIIIQLEQDGQTEI